MLVHAQAVEKHYCLAAFAAHREHGQQQQAETVASVQLVVGGFSQIPSERASVVAHPADHVQDQQAGQQHQRRLEPLAGRAG
ncbi:hypothetical protein D9M68_905870 [compost metagenome]